MGSRCRIATTLPLSTVNKTTTSGNSFTRNWCGRHGWKATLIFAPDGDR
jgi:hypothetical protein